MNKIVLYIFLLCCSAVSAVAQVDAYSGATKPAPDTTKKSSEIRKSHNDDFESFRFGGYGEMLAKFMAQ